MRKGECSRRGGKLRGKRQGHIEKAAVRQVESVKIAEGADGFLAAAKVGFANIVYDHESIKSQELFTAIIIPFFCPSVKYFARPCPAFIVTVA